MIRFFKSSYIIQYTAILLAGVILWGRSFFDPPPMPEPDGFVPLYRFLYQILAGLPVVQAVLGFLLVAGSALLLNTLLYGHNIVQKNTSLTGFMYVILMSYYPAFLTIHPVNFSAFFLLLVLSRLMSSYSSEEPFDILFSAGFITAIASYIYFPFILFYGYILASLIFFRQMKWREWMSSFLGLLIPFIYLGTYYFWTDSLVIKASEYVSMFRFSMDFAAIREPAYIVFTAIILLSSLFALSFSLRNRIDKTIERTRKNLLLNWLIIFVLGTLPLTGGLTAYHAELMFIPCAAVVSYYLMQIRKTFWPEKIFILFILILIFNNLLFRWL